jgi:hypothetical protein
MRDGRESDQKCHIILSAPGILLFLLILWLGFISLSGQSSYHHYHVEPGRYMCAKRKGIIVGCVLCKWAK